MSNLYIIASKEHADAVRERDAFLRNHPQLRQFQRDIDKKLHGASSTHNRLALIHHLMMENFKKLNSELQSLARAKRRRRQSGL